MPRYKNPHISAEGIQRVTQDSEDNNQRYQRLLRQYRVQTPWQLIEALDNKVIELTQMPDILKTKQTTFPQAPRRFDSHAAAHANGGY